MKRFISILGATLVLAPAALATEDDRAQRALEKVSVGMSGNTAVVKEGFESTLYYKVCVFRKANKKRRACRAGETNVRGYGRISFARFVAKQGKGRYEAVWTGGGLELGRETFKAR